MADGGWLLLLLLLMEEDVLSCAARSDDAPIDAPTEDLGFC